MHHNKIKPIDAWENPIPFPGGELSPEDAYILETFPTAISKRERQVFWFVAHGLSLKEIAGHMGTSQRTVEIHKTHLVDKIPGCFKASSLGIYAAEILKREREISKHSRVNPAAMSIKGPLFAKGFLTGNEVTAGCDVCDTKALGVELSGPDGKVTICYSCIVNLKASLTGVAMRAFLFWRQPR